jgi:hypothetical protein
MFVSPRAISPRFKSMLLAPHALAPHPSGFGVFVFVVEPVIPCSTPKQTL